jgi:hypothetical protein
MRPPEAPRLASAAAALPPAEKAMPPDAVTVKQPSIELLDTLKKLLEDRGPGYEQAAIDLAIKAYGIEGQAGNVTKGSGDRPCIRYNLELTDALGRAHRDGTIEIGPRAFTDRLPNGSLEVHTPTFLALVLAHEVTHVNQHANHPEWEPKEGETRQRGVARELMAHETIWNQRNKLQPRLTPGELKHLFEETARYKKEMNNATKKAYRAGNYYQVR